MVTLIVWGVVLLFALLCLVNAVYIVGQQTSSVIERFGKFVTIAGPGLHLKIPFIDNVAENLSLRVEQLNVDVETKTKNNVFVTLSIAVQYAVKPDSVYDAYYKLTDPEEQIESYIYDTVRSEVPKMELNDLFENKNVVADAVQREVNETMSQYGYTITRTLVNNIVTDEKVKEALNAVVAAENHRQAAIATAEGVSQALILQATARSEEKKLQGEGIAKEREAIANGLAAQVQTLTEGAQGIGVDEVFHILQMTQYMDMMRDVAGNAKSHVVFLDHSPAGLADLSDQIRRGTLGAAAAESPNGNTPKASATEE